MAPDSTFPAQKCYEHFKMADQNVDLFLHRTRRVLQIFGIWPMPENLPSHQMVLYQFYTGLILASQYSFLLFEFIYIANVFGDFDELSESSFLLFTQASLCYKTTVFLLSKNKLFELLDFMESDVFAPHNEIHKSRLSKQARIIGRLCLFFIVCANTTCSLWALVPLLSSGPRMFPFKIWMPFGPERSPQYELGYAYQQASIYISACLFAGVDSVTLCMIMFGCAQLEIIGDKLQMIQKVPLSSKQKPEERDKLLRDNTSIFVDCVKHHHAVIRFIETVENTYHKNIFFQLSGTVGIICIIGLRLSAVDPSSIQFMSMVNYLMTMLSQLFLYCWCGQELTIRSEYLREWMYQCPWYEQGGRFNRCLWIAMERMKRPIIFRAGRYIPLSRPTFVSILRSSYSYFAVLNQAKNK